MQNIRTSTENDEIDLQKIFFIFWRRKFLIALICTVFVLAGGYYAFKMTTPIYEASSVTMVSSQSEKLIDLPSVLAQIGTDDVALKSEIEVIRSRILIGKVVDMLDLTSDPEFNGALREPTAFSQLVSSIKGLLPTNSKPTAGRVDPERTRERVVSALLAHFTANVVPGTTTFRITVQSEDPEKAALIADTIAEQYVQRQIDVKRGATVDAIDWLSDRVAELKVALQNSENAVKQFKTDTPLTTPEVLSGLERQLKSIRDRIDETRQRVAASDDFFAAFEQATGYEDKAVLLGDATLIDLSATASRSRSAASRFNARMETLLAERRRDATENKSQLASLESAEAAVEQKIQTESAAYLELEQLTREAEANRTLYEYFLARLKETSAQQGVQQADSVILSYAVEPGAASAPSKKRIVLLSGFVGLIFGCALSMLLEMRNKTFRTSQELEELAGLPVVGMLPLVPAKHRNDFFHYLQSHPTSPFAEAVRNLRTSVLLAHLDNPPQVILLTSSIPGEGKTSSSIGLALNFASMGKRVLLVEGDLRRLTFNRYFDNSKRAAGLISVLSGKTSLEEAVFHHDELDIDILFGERSTKNAADILSSRKMDELLREARSKYDFVIVDAPPVLIVPDARVLSQFVDAILFIVKWDSTHQRQVEEAIRSFEEGKIEGLVLNQIDPNGFKRYGYNYGYGYGYAAHYGDKYYDTASD
ncbi:polysaccharide biosynthesis tyrosine autokinase [Martelella mediterranea]|uniref:GumC family protein n=1 Tax=Martelella mediterranea TaxID=293089 RepID=UPI001E3C267C|nr:polysaccharide biosynthesis tyrosine autokinase [Martelella mediterranea]MCD1634280.1 polysaccharide biosynthesis tyrosine autokinase [Martelella mediterranea]